MDELFKLLGLGTPFIYAGGTYAFFHWLDLNASDEAKAALSRLLRVREYDKQKISDAILQVFDRVYTHPLLTGRAFLRSALITISISVLYLFELSFDFGAFVVGFLTVASDTRFLYDDFYAAVLLRALVFEPLVSLCVNILSDYGALFIIRRWLITSSNGPLISLSIAALIGCIVVLLSFAIRLFVIYLFLHVAGLQFFLRQLLAPSFLAIPTIIVFTWLPLFAIGLGAIMLLNLLVPAVGTLQWFLKEGQQRPIIAVGYVAGAIVFVIAVALRLFVSEPQEASLLYPYPSRLSNNE